MLIGFAAHELSKQLDFITPVMRFVAFLAFLGGVFGYSSQKVVKSIEYKQWVPRP
jgi:hypothetical protein